VLALSGAAYAIADFDTDGDGCLNEGELIAMLEEDFGDATEW